MPKLPICLRYELLIPASLILGSCDNMPATFTRADKAGLDAAYDQAMEGPRASSEMVDRVERLESRVADLESKLNM
jgi:hypothetical protein